MSIDYDENLLLGYVEDELGEADRRRVERWLADDPRLRSLVEGMAADRRRLRESPEPPAPAWIMEEVDRRLERSMLLETPPGEQGQRDVHQRFVFNRVAAYSALAALVLGALTIVLWSVVQLGGDKPAYPAASGPMAMDESAGDSDQTLRREAAEPTRERPAETESGPMMSKSGPAPTPPPAPPAAKAPPSPPVAADPAPVANKAGSSVPRTVEAATEQSVAARQLAAERGEVLRRPEPRQALPSQPTADAAPPRVVQVVVRTRDVDRSLSRLNYVADNIRDAQVQAEPVGGAAMQALAAEAANAQAHGREPVAMDFVRAIKRAKEASSDDRATLAQAAPASAEPRAPSTHARRADKAGSRFMYNLLVPSDQVDQAIELLHTEPNNGDYQQIIVQREREALAEGGVDAPDVLRNWPRLTPDYGNIIRQQLPLVASVGMVDIPVVIEPADGETDVADGGVEPAGANAAATIPPEPEESEAAANDALDSMPPAVAPPNE